MGLHLGSKLLLVVMKPAAYRIFTVAIGDSYEESGIYPRPAPPSLATITKQPNLVEREEDTHTHTQALSDYRQAVDDLPGLNRSSSPPPPNQG
jgi:hypothetical protein